MDVCCVLLCEGAERWRALVDRGDRAELQCMFRALCDLHLCTRADGGYLAARAFRDYDLCALQWLARIDATHELELWSPSALTSLCAHEPAAIDALACKLHVLQHLVSPAHMPQKQCLLAVLLTRAHEGTQVRRAAAVVLQLFAGDACRWRGPRGESVFHVLAAARAAPELVPMFQRLRAHALLAPPDADGRSPADIVAARTDLDATAAESVLAFFGV